MHLAIGLKIKKHDLGESHTTTNIRLWDIWSSGRKMLFIPKAKNDVIWESSVKHYPMNYFGMYWRMKYKTTYIRNEMLIHCIFYIVLSIPFKTF